MLMSTFVYYRRIQQVLLYSRYFVSKLSAVKELQAYSGSPPGICSFFQSGGSFMPVAV